MQTVREAALRPTAAEFYPDLPARMWTTATHLAELVARYHGVVWRPRAGLSGSYPMPTSCFATEARA